jgi:uncharacterized protein (TIGR03435 family)
MAAFLPMRRLFLAAILMLPLSAFAQQPPGGFTFDVVSIKPDKTGDGSTSINQNQDRYAATNVRLKEMLRYAYSLTTEDQISSLPGWAEAAHFDVEAKMDAETVAALKALPQEENFAQRKVMMQQMLAERFQLKLHHETRELPIYSLVLAKGGAKLKEFDASGQSKGGSMSVRNGEMTAQGVAISSLADFLAQQLHRQVLDKTGLTGKYDLTLKWTRDEMAGGTQDGGAPRGRSTRSSWKVSQCLRRTDAEC